MELPELLILADQMTETIAGQTIQGIELRQPKCLNAPEAEYQRLAGRKILGARAQGKWVVITVEGGWLLLLNVGMGADVYYYHWPERPPAEKVQCRLDLEGGAGVTIRFWWFGNLHRLAQSDLQRHPASQIGPTPFDPAFTAEWLAALARPTRRAIKSLITDQKRLAGIGNAYIHDIMFLAGLHPLTPASRLPAEAVCRLHGAILEGLRRGLDKHGMSFERDFFGRRGGFEAKDFLVGYRKNQPCHTCGTPIERIKTGSTASYICPRCQPL